MSWNNSFRVMVQMLSGTSYMTVEVFVQEKKRGEGSRVGAVGSEAVPSAHV